MARGRNDVDFSYAVADGIYASVCDDGCRPRIRLEAPSDSRYAAGFALGRTLRRGARYHCEFTEPLNTKPAAL